jgi:hypothetical protein
MDIMSSCLLLQKLREQRELERRKREAEERKQHGDLEVTPPVSSPAEKGRTVPGTSVVVMPPLSTDNVIYPDMLELEKSDDIHKRDSLPVSVPR